MTDRFATIRLPEALARATEHWRNKGGDVGGRTPGTTIAISREEGAGGTRLAREVGARLGWPVYDHELLEKIADDMKLRAALLESVDEKYVSWLEESMASYTQVRGVDRNAFVVRLMATILSLARHGQCLIVGRGSPHILPAASTLRVRVIASLADRIDRLARERNISPDDARRDIEVADSERARFLNVYFHVDGSDPHLYDVILNLSFYSMPQAVDIVVEACRLAKTRLTTGELVAR
jgi:cytidylate kinase